MMIMHIMSVLIIIGFFAMSWFLTRLFLRMFLGPLYEEGIKSKKSTQYSIIDIYLLIAQFSIALLPVALAPLSNAERIDYFIAIPPFLVLSWFLCCRMLTRIGITRLKPRLIAMLVFHFQLGFAVFYGFGALLLIGLLFAAFPVGLGFTILFLGLFSIFGHVSRAIYNEREKDPETLTQLASDVKRSAPQDDTLPEK